MKYFQITAFIFHIIICIALIILGIVCLYKVGIENEGIEARTKRQQCIVKIMVVIGALMCIVGVSYSLIPMLKDMPRLINGDFCVVVGYPEIEGANDKDIFEHVYMYEEKINFFIKSNMDSNNLYKVLYLPNSGQGIDAEEISQVDGMSTKEVKAPLEEFLKTMWLKVLLIPVLFVIIVLLYDVAFKVLKIGSVIFYSLNVYFYFNVSEDNGAWLSISNVPLQNIIIGIIILLIWGAIYLVEKGVLRKKIDTYGFENNYKEASYSGTRIFAIVIVYVYVIFTLLYLI